MTDKQILLYDYLLKRLNYNLDDSIHSEFLKYLGSSASQFRSIRNTKIEPKHPQRQYYDYDTSTGLYVPNRYNIIDYLFDEVAVKTKKKLARRSGGNSDFTNATEYSSFQFCPISSILQSRFIIPPTVSQAFGTDMHERALLINRIKKDKAGDSLENQFDYQKQTTTYISDENKHFFDEVDNSKIVFAGHVSQNKKYFVGSRAKFIGQPDYIFTNANGENFVVEEKFTKISDYERSATLYNSHKIQLLSYIYMLDELKIDYGYVLYWVYRELDGMYGSTFMALDEVVVYRLNRTNRNRYFLGETYKKYHHFKSNEQLIGSNRVEINPKKCASCSSSMFCVHKMNSNTELNLGINYEDLYQVNYIPFPDELRKTDEERSEAIEESKEAIAAKENGDSFSAS